MAINPNIILAGEMPKFDTPVEAANKVLTMRQLAQRTRAADEEFARQDALKQSFAKNLGPDGNLNRKAVVADLTKSDPMKAMEIEKSFEDQDMQKMARQAALARELAWSIDGPETYAAARQKGIELGMPNADKLPQYYPGKEFIENMKMRTLSHQEQLAEKWKQKEYAIKDRESRATTGGGGGGAGGLPKKLNSEDRKRIDNIKMAKKAVMGMADAYKKGDFTFSLVGDNNFTMNASRWDEALGRMQSGGAITAEEADCFRGMMPRPTDSRDIQRQKLRDMAEEMDERLGTFGIAPEKLPGYKPGKPFDAGATAKIFKTSEIEWAD